MGLPPRGAAGRWRRAGGQVLRPRRAALVRDGGEREGSSPKPRPARHGGWGVPRGVQRTLHRREPEEKKYRKCARFAVGFVLRKCRVISADFQKSRLQNIFYYYCFKIVFTRFYCLLSPAPTRATLKIAGSSLLKSVSRPLCSPCWKSRLLDILMMINFFPLPFTIDKTPKCS